MGIPGVSIIVKDFLRSAQATGKGAGLPNIRLALYPGGIAVHPAAELEANVRDVLFPQIVKLLTAPVEDTVVEREANAEGNIVFEGSFEEVNEFFHRNQWSDGLPIVPPTADKVADFLRCTAREPDDVLGHLHPSLRRCTVHSVAVNGVMAGCRPEHMPILVSIVEVIADGRWHLEDAGSSAGWAPLIILNGPVIEKLGFNSETGVLRAGNRNNSSVGRFLRIIMRNVAGFIPGLGDMATFGRPDFPVLAEAQKASPWEPLSVTRGFADEDSVVTLTSVGYMSFQVTLVTQGPENLLRNLSIKLRQMMLASDGSIITKGPEMSPTLVLSPVIAASIAEGGYSKRDVQEFIFEHHQVPASELDLILALQGLPNTNSWVEKGVLPALFGESIDPLRQVPLYRAPEELQIVVAGTRNRNRFMLIHNISRQGLATSRRIDLSRLD